MKSAASSQGLTLVHSSAQLERFLLGRGVYVRGCVARDKGVLGGV